MYIEDNKKEICKEVEVKYLKEKGLKKEDIKNNENDLKELITLLKDKYNISFRTISETININREKIRKEYNKKNRSK